MSKAWLIILMMPLILTACSFKVSTEQNLVNDDIQHFAEKRKFDDDKILRYKVNEAVICPIFRNRKDDQYSLNISAYSKDPDVISVTIVSCDLEVQNKELENVFSAQINEKIKFKPEQDKAYWGKGVFFATKKMFENKHIKLNKNMNITLRVAVEVESKKGKKTKKLNYDFRYDEDKYLVDLAQ